VNSRERLLSVLEGKSTDRVPISTYELCGFNSKALENNELSYKKLMEYIRSHTDCVCMWNPLSNQGYGLSSHPVTRERESYRKGNYTITQFTIHTPLGELTHTIRVSDKVNTTWHTERLCKTTKDVDAYLSIPYEPVAYDYSDYGRILREVGDRGIIMASLEDPVCTAMELMEFGQATVWAMTETDHFQKTIDILHERTMNNLKNMLKIAVVDLYRICGPEYMTPPFLPPMFFGRFVTPYLREMTRLIHQYGGKVRIHSHGKINKVLKDILKSGADAIDPCEAPPDGDITLAQIKKQIGEKMCIFGNIQLKMLEHGSQDDVKKEVSLCMESAKSGGRYVIMPTASPINFPLSPKTEGNYKVFIETALEIGGYY